MFMPLQVNRSIVYIAYDESIKNHDKPVWQEAGLT